MRKHARITRIALVIFCLAGAVFTAESGALAAGHVQSAAPFTKPTATPRTVSAANSNPIVGASAPTPTPASGINQLAPSGGAPGMPSSPGGPLVPLALTLIGVGVAARRLRR